MAEATKSEYFKPHMEAITELRKDYKFNKAFERFEKLSCEIKEGGPEDQIGKKKREKLACKDWLDKQLARYYELQGKNPAEVTPLPVSEHVTEEDTSKAAA